VAGTFSYRAPGTNAHISGIVQNTQSPDRLMCTKNSSFLFLSQDRGKKWMRIEKGLPADTKFTLGCPAMADRAGIYFLPINNQGVYRSEDLGQTWTRPANKGLDALNVTGQWSPVQNVLVAAPDAGWLALANNGKLFISTDRAETWKVTATSFTVSRLAADPTEPNVLYAAGNGIFRKTDQGQTWQTLLAQSDPVGLLAVRNRRVLAYTEGKAPDSTIGRLAYKLLLTENEGKTWTNLLNRSMAVWRLQSIAFDPFDAGRVYANSYWAGAWVAQRPATAQTQPATDSAPAK